MLIEHLVENNGPENHEYDKLSEWFNSVNSDYKNGKLLKSDIDSLRGTFGKVFSDSRSLQGRIYNKPLGYAGDYIVIDRIYTKSVSQIPEFYKWDLFIQSLDACKAVRNRKKYFIEYLKSLSKIKDNLNVLNLASGSCRDIVELFEDSEVKNIRFDCVDFDINAINFAKKNIKRNKENVNFIHQNILKIKTNNKYDVIWSAGMFDYLSDKIFKFVVKKNISLLKENGELIIGNFHPINPSRNAMEFGEWFLNYRNEKQLQELVEDLGVNKSSVKVRSEEMGINLFLHVKDINV